MKKLLLPVLLALAGIVHANTPTPTLTWTPTYTNTFTPTYTETPITRRRDQYIRVYKQIVDLKSASDALTAPALTPTPGGIWMASQNGVPYFVFGTGTAAVYGAAATFHWKVPANYAKLNGNVPTLTPTTIGTATNTPTGTITPTVTPVPQYSGGGKPATLYLENAWNSTVTGTVQICVNVVRIKQNADFSNAPNFSTWLGVTQNVQTQPNSIALQSVTSVASLVSLYYAEPAALSQAVAGDDLQFNIIRIGGSGNLSVGGLDIEYKPVAGGVPLINP